MEGTHSLPFHFHFEYNAVSVMGSGPVTRDVDTYSLQPLKSQGR